MLSFVKSVVKDAPEGDRTSINTWAEHGRLDQCKNKGTKLCRQGRRGIPERVG